MAIPKGDHRELFRPLSPDGSPDRVFRGKRSISFRREWTVNYGHYCPPVNNNPPHYMWELLTLDRLDSVLSSSLSLSFSSCTRVYTTRAIPPASSSSLYFSHISSLPHRSFFLPESIRSCVSCTLILSFALSLSLSLSLSRCFVLRDILDRTTSQPLAFVCVSARSKDP